MMTLVSNYASITARSQLIHFSGALLLSRISIAKVEGPARRRTASGTSKGSPSKNCPMMPPEGGGKIILIEIKKKDNPASDSQQLRLDIEPLKQMTPQKEKYQ